MSRKIKLNLLVPGIVALGFLRDYLFENINWIYLTKTINRKNQARKEFYELLEWSNGEIVLLKWSLTLIFFGLFLGISVWIIHLLFSNRFYNKITILVYVAIFVVSGALFFLGNWFGFYDRFYAIVITMMHLTQSFVPLLVLFMVFKFFPKTENQ